MFFKRNEYIKEKELIEHNLEEVKKSLLNVQKVIIATSIGVVVPNNDMERNKSELIQYLIDAGNDLNTLNRECSKYINFMVNSDQRYFSELIKEVDIVANDIEESIMSLKLTIEKINELEAEGKISLK